MEMGPVARWLLVSYAVLVYVNINYVDGLNVERARITTTLGIGPTATPTMPTTSTKSVLLNGGCK